MIVLLPFITGDPTVFDGKRSQGKDRLGCAGVDSFADTVLGLSCMSTASSADGGMNSAASSAREN